MSRLDTFSCENTFNLLIILEDSADIISNDQKDKFTEILNSNRYKRTLIVTDRDVAEYQSGIRNDEENLLKLEKFKLTNITKQSLTTLLAKEVNFQGATVKFHEILDISDRDLHSKLFLSDLKATTQISGTVTDPKIYDNDFFIPRRLKYCNVILQKISEIEIDTDKIVFDEISFDKSCNEFPLANVHLLKRQIEGEDFEWKKTRGNIGFLLNYVIEARETCLKYDWSSNGSVFVLIDVAGMGKTLSRFF